MRPFTRGAIRARPVLHTLRYTIDSNGRFAGGPRCRRSGCSSMHPTESGVSVELRALLRPMGNL